MKLIITDHLRSRLILRKIPLKMVKEIFLNTEEKYFDHLRNHYIVVGNALYKGKVRKMLAAYDKIEERFEVVTTHPIDERQIAQRIKSGRWTYEK